MTLMYDPPFGWQFGFPKPYRPLDGETLRDTLTRDGYPSGPAYESSEKYCRFFETDLEEGITRDCSSND